MKKSQADIAEIMAISANITKKVKRGNPALIINQFAEKLAEKEIALSPAQADNILAVIDRIESGKPEPTDNIINTIGSRGGKRKEGNPISWWKNLIYIWQAAIIVDFRNDRIIDFQAGQVFDFNKKTIIDMTAQDINDLMRISMTNSETKEPKS